MSYVEILKWFKIRKDTGLCKINAILMLLIKQNTIEYNGKERHLYVIVVKSFTFVERMFSSSNRLLLLFSSI